MIFVSALLAAIPVALVGDVQAKDLDKWLGSGYTVSRYARLADAEKSDLGIIVIDRIPSAGHWASERDGFVSSLENDLLGVKSKAPHARIFVLLPETPTSAFAADTYSAEVIPLLKQAAAETDTETIDVKDEASTSEDISDAVIDFAAQKAGWHLVSADSQEMDEGPAANAIDGRLDTYWHTRYSPRNDPYPHQITVDMGSQVSLAGFRYVPRQDGGTNGRIKKYEFFLSADGKEWGDPVAAGEFPNSPRPASIHFQNRKTGRYFKLVALSEQFGGPWASAAEIDVLPAP